MDTPIVYNTRPCLPRSTWIPEGGINASLFGAIRKYNLQSVMRQTNTGSWRSGSRPACLREPDMAYSPPIDRFVRIRSQSLFASSRSADCIYELSNFKSKTRYPDSTYILRPRSDQIQSHGFAQYSGYSLSNRQKATHIATKTNLTRITSVLKRITFSCSKTNHSTPWTGLASATNLVQKRFG